MYKYFKLSLVMTGFLLLACAINGCACATFTAYDRVDHKINLRSESPIKTIFVNSSGCSGVNLNYCDIFQTNLRVCLEKEGYELTSDPLNANLILSFNSHTFYKKYGTFIWLIYSGIAPDTITGLRSKVLYKTDKGKFSKTYLAYSRRDYYQTDATSIIVLAIINDLRNLKRNN